MVVCSKIIKNGKRRFLYNLHSCIGKAFQNDFAVISRKQTVIFYDILYRFEQLLFVKIFQL
ncbi:Uncharacterised protein [Chryseobacterium gleum]|uniref:Uncharacterized protein n=1 Tax=Chryseobacterium gleum TaxID=250 RepID=A0A448B8S0_CHRGE|nr:Uncharacterised protein [Chryseobacterium gleum]